MKLILAACLVSLAYGQLGGMPGGLSTQPLTDPKWVAMLNNNNLFSSNAQLEIVKVQTQVVNGINTFFTLKVDGVVCTVVLYDQAWIGTHKVTRNDCPKTKRMAGGWHPGNPTDTNVMGAVTAVLDAVNAMSNNMFAMVQNGDVKVEQQVVAGENYHLKFLVGSSTCTKSDHSDYSHCPLDAVNSMATMVEATVWFQAWRKPQYVITNGPTTTDTAEDNKVKLGGGNFIKKVKSQRLGGNDGHECGGLFADFVQKYKKLYLNAKEKNMRYGVFCRNMQTAKKLQESERGTATYGATKFADLTQAEFSRYVGKQWDQTANDGMKKAYIPKDQIPDSFDWRDHGAVTKVKNQGSCGSCWAFSTTGNIEGQWAIKKKSLISLSEQELVDCDKLDEGCNGGLPSNAYKEIERLGGLETETEYQYKGDDEKCQFIKSEVKVYINSSLSISSNETEMAAWLAVNGPISIGINAFAMQFYMGGISHPWKIFCNPKSLDHGVLIVGYGVENSTPYWIVKNSWGPDWGEKGYYLVYRGDGVCGLNTMCTSAVVD